MLLDLTQFRVERCPKCGSKDIQRSRRRSILDFAIGFVFRPWRCTVCFVRFYRPRWMKGAPRHIEVGKPPVSAKTSVTGMTHAEGSVSPGKETPPGIVERNPLLGFFPAGGEVRHVQDSVTFRAEQLGS